MSEHAGIRLLPDLIDLAGVKHDLGWEPVLQRYLHQHPGRIEGLLRLVPEAAAGIRAHCAVRDRVLWVERLVVPGLEDPLVDMLLWHAVFPGLRAPLIPWWYSGDLQWYGLLPDEQVPEDDLFDPDSTVAAPAAGPWRTDRGRLVCASDDQEGRGVFDRDPYEWPLWTRLAFVPLAMVMVPAAGVWMSLGPDRRNMPWWTIPAIPVVLVLFIVKFCAPAAYDRHLEPHVQVFTERRMQRHAVRELIDSALQRDRSRTTARR